MKGALLILLLAAHSLLSFAPVNTKKFTAVPVSYPKGYFRNPLDIPIQLAANFGELRTNHFHMGLDIRTNQKENLPVYAAAEGYISKIKIEKNGKFSFWLVRISSPMWKWLVRSSPKLAASCMGISSGFLK